MRPEGYALDRAVLRPSAHAPRRRPRACEVCGKLTNDGKPCCAEHVECMPYVGAVLSALAAYDLEIEATNLGKAFAEGVLLGELVVALRQGSKTTARIAKELRLTRRGSVALVRLAERMGLVTTWKTRKSFWVKLKEGA